MGAFPEFSEQFLKRLSLMRFKPKPGILGRGAGEHLVRKGGASVEFADFRTYSFGDDFRLIDWNSYARLDRLYVKLYRDEEGIPIHFLLDCSPSMDYGQPSKLFYAQRLSAALGYIALSAYNWVALQSIPEGFSFEETRGRGRILPFFTFLSGLGALKPCHLSQELTSYAQRDKKSCLLFILTDAFDPLGLELGLKDLLALGHQIVLIHLLAPEEIAPQCRGDFELEDLEWGNKVDISLDEDNLEIYKKTLTDWCQELRHFSYLHEIPYIFCSTATPLEEFVSKELPRLGVLR